jgi:hypothetical protein
VSFCILLIFFYQIIHSLLLKEYILFFPLIVLLLDFALKFFLKETYINLLPYLVLPFEKKALIKSVLLLEITNIWNWYCCVGIVFLLSKNYFAGTDLNCILFSINLYLLFLLNSYYVSAIKNTLNKIVSLLLFPFLFIFILPVYLSLPYSGILCAIITLGLIIVLFYSGTHFITNKIYRQLNESSF